MKKTAILLAFIGFWGMGCGLLGSSEPQTTNNNTAQPATPAPSTITTNNNNNNGNNNGKTFTEADLNFNGKKVILTKHAKCRMDCRELDAFEIQEVINKGKINERKTNRQATPCPSIAYEGFTRDGQEARIIVGDCDPAKIITVIDLSNDYECTCD